MDRRRLRARRAPRPRAGAVADAAARRRHRAHHRSERHPVLHVELRKPGVDRARRGPGPAAPSRPVLRKPQPHDHAGGAAGGAAGRLAHQGGQRLARAARISAIRRCSPSPFSPAWPARCASCSSRSRTGPTGRTAAGTTPGLWSAVAGNRAFLGLVVSGFVWNLALQVAAPFFNVYLVRHLGAGAGTVGLLAGVNTLFGLIGSGLFVRVMDRMGALKTQALDRPPDPDHPDGLDLGHRALAGRRARGLCGTRLGRLQPGQLRAPPRGHARIAPGPGRGALPDSRVHECRREARCSAAGSPIRSGSRSSSARAARAACSAYCSTSGSRSGRFSGAQRAGRRRRGWRSRRPRR